MSIRLGDGTLIAGGAQTFPLLSTMWADHILNDVSWLRADTFSWQSGDVYKSVYEKLVAEYVTGTTETEGAITFKRTESGFKIADSTQEQAILDLYNSTGVAWYYILDTTNKRFKLPRTKYNFTGLRDSVGSYVAESLPKPQLIMRTDSSSSTDTDLDAIYGNDGYTATTPSNTSGADEYMHRTYTATSNNLKYMDIIGSSYKDNAPVQQRATQMYLYFFVGNYVQNQTAIDIGQMSEQLNGKVDLDMHNSQKPYIVETYDDSNGNGYRVWSNKFCEQWGNFQSNDGTINTITFLKEWKDDKYNPIVGMMYGNSGSANYWVFAIRAKTEINMNVQNATNGTGNVCYWSAKGYIL